MPSVQELVTRVKIYRNVLYRESKNRPPGFCDFIGKVVDENKPNSHLWRSSTPMHSGDYLSHLVGVIGTRGRRGVIIQFSGENSQDTRIVLGSVSDIHDEQKVANAIKEQTRRIGWILEY